MVSRPTSESLPYISLSRTYVPFSLQNGRSLVFPVCGKTANSRDKMLH